MLSGELTFLFDFCYEEKVRDFETTRCSSESWNLYSM
jgi:hypothetical protein